MTKIKGVLLDIDGTLTWKKSAIYGAAQAIGYLRSHGYPFRLLTNISARRPEHIAAELAAVGIAIAASEIQTSATACAAYLRDNKKSISDYFIPESIMPLFEGITVNNQAPEIIVVGDAGEAFSFENMNAAFKSLHAGAALVAMQKNMYWFSPAGVQIDCGAFVSALESATGVTATITGKPSKTFFDSAIASLGLTADQVLVVGDDVLTDVAGAQAVGARSALVKTGKGNDNVASQTNPDFTLACVAQLPDLLKALA